MKRFKNPGGGIGIIFGTRPEIIKLSPIIRLLHKAKQPYFLLHTGQHYSYEMDRLFFDELELPEPKHKLFVHQQSASGHGDHTGRMLDAVEKILMKEKPRVVLVQGDTNSVLAGSLVTAKLGTGAKLGHVEAGLRSYDRQMPEEVNRIISDHLSDFLFAPTTISEKTLLHEGISKKKVFVTGNTIVDAAHGNLALALRKNRALPYGLSDSSPFFLLTLHRQENVDNRDRLVSIFEGLGAAGKHFGRPIIFPAHPRTVKMITALKVRLPECVKLEKPCGFLDFLKLESVASLIFTDSGGVQEEACILKTPCVTLRTTTERPETLTVGASVLAGYKPGSILNAAKRMYEKKRLWKNPFGDGRAAERILKIISRSL